MAGLLLQFKVLTFNELILHCKFVLLSHASMGTEVFNSVLDVLGLLEAVRRGDLVIEIDLFLIEDEYVASRDNISLKIDQVSSSVYQASILIV